MKPKTSLPPKVIRELIVSHSYADPEKGNPRKYLPIRTEYIETIDSPTEELFEKRIYFGVKGGRC